MHILPKTLLSLLPAAAFSALAFAPTAAEAGIEACGNIHLAAGAQCEFKTSGGCLAECEPLNFKAACAAEGALGCQGDCSLDADVACTTDCNADCRASCDIDPAQFDCRAACQTDCAASCDGTCEARCSDSECLAECSAGCEATCSTECDVGCDIEPGQVDCEAQCNGCCGGSCSAEINLDCQLDCQADLQVSCEAELQGGCEIACEDPQGALFCDGQYVNVDNLEACLLALADELNIEVDASGECSGNRCEGQISVGCFGTVDPERQWNGILALGLGFGWLAAGRRRRRD
jgi:hypothetical protein